MQESELDKPGLADSQEWVDVPQDQVTEVGVAVVAIVIAVTLSFRSRG